MEVETLEQVMRMAAARSGLPHRAIAQEMGISVKTVSAYMNGVRRPTPLRLERLLRGFGCSDEEIQLAARLAWPYIAELVEKGTTRKEVQSVS